MKYSSQQNPLSLDLFKSSFDDLSKSNECWTGMYYFVKNVMKFLWELCLVLSEIWLIFAVGDLEERKVRCALKVAKY